MSKKPRPRPGLLSLDAARGKIDQARAKRGQYTGLRVEHSVAERARSAVHWTPGETMRALVERAILAEVEQMESERDETFPPRPKP